MTNDEEYKFSNDLRLATIAGDLKLVKKLFESNNDHWLARNTLILAVSAEQLSIVEYLHKRANLQAIDFDDYDCLGEDPIVSIAVCTGNLDILRYLHEDMKIVCCDYAAMSLERLLGNHPDKYDNMKAYLDDNFDVLLLDEYKSALDGFCCGDEDCPNNKEDEE